MDERKNVIETKDVLESPKPCKKAYEKPRIIEQIPLKAEAGTCDPSGGGKADLVNCSILTS